MLSLSHNFIFVHVPKTAGTAVLRALEPYARAKSTSIFRRFSRRLPFPENAEKVHLRGHDPARHIIAKLGRAKYDSLTSFAVVRNPFDHAVSHYEYMKQFRLSSVAAKAQGMNFEEFLRYRMTRPLFTRARFTHMPNQTWYLTDATGKMAVDEILRFENLDADFAALGEKLGLGALRLEKVNPTKTRTKKKPIDSYYNDETLKLVHEIYDADFEFLGYSRALP